MSAARRAAILGWLATQWLAAVASAAAEDSPVEGFALPPALAGGDLEVEVEPARMLLGTGEEGRVTAALPAGAGEVRVLAGLGDVDGVVLEEGRVLARYRAPEIRRPALDVVAVLAEEGGRTLFGFAVVQLMGQGRAVISTRPLAEAEIEIRGVRFGPVRADRRGRAEIRVVVPPGTQSGVDGEGREVDLGVPPASGLFAFAGAVEARAGDRGIPIFAVSPGPDGGPPEEDPVPAIDASRGSLSEAIRVGPGLHRWDWDAPDAVPEGEDPEGVAVAIDLALPGEETSAARLDLRLSFPEPESEPEPEPEPEPADEVREPPVLLAPKIGYATNLGSLHGLGVSLELGVRLPVTGAGLRVVLEPGFAWSGTSGRVRAGDGERLDLRASTWVVPATLGIAWRIPLGSLFGLSIAGRGGAALIANRIEGPKSGDRAIASAERRFAPVAGGTLAVDLGLGPGALLLEAGYLWVGGDLESLEGSPSLLQIRLGYAFGLGR